MPTYKTFQIHCPACGGKVSVRTPKTDETWSTAMCCPGCQTLFFTWAEADRIDIRVFTNDLTGVK